MTEDIWQHLDEWLSKGGYPLEMQVARHFRDARWRVVQAEFYTDPDTQTSREIDLVAYRQADFDGRVVRMSLVVECKSTSRNPWVLFTDGSIRLPEGEQVTQNAASHYGTIVLRELSKVASFANLQMFQLPERPGYALREAFGGKADNAYKAVMSVTNAVAALSKEVGAVAEIMFPMVVIEGRLFECYLKEDNQPTFGEVNGGVLVWRRPVAQRPYAFVKVVTTAGLAELVGNADLAVTELLAHGKRIEQAMGRRARKPGNRRE